MKKVKILFMSLLVLLTVGCGEKPKEVCEPDDYLIAVNELGHQVEDHTDYFAYSEATYLIDTNNFYAIYVKGKKKYDVEGLFLDECKNIYSDANEGYTKKTAGKENWVSLEVKDDKTYYYVIYVEDTYLYIKTDLANESVAKDLINKIGY